MEREEGRLAYLSSIFDTDYFVATLKIKPEDITEFKHFALYEILKNVKKENKTSNLKDFSKNDLELSLILLAKEYIFLKYETETIKEY